MSSDARTPPILISSDENEPVADLYLFSQHQPELRDLLQEAAQKFVRGDLSLPRLSSEETAAARDISPDWESLIDEVPLDVIARDLDDARRLLVSYAPLGSLHASLTEALLDPTITEVLQRLVMSKLGVGNVSEPQYYFALCANAALRSLARNNRLELMAEAAGISFAIAEEQARQELSSIVHNVWARFGRDKEMPQIVFVDSSSPVVGQYEPLAWPQHYIAINSELVARERLLTLHPVLADNDDMTEPCLSLRDGSGIWVQDIITHEVLHALDSWNVTWHTDSSGDPMAFISLGIYKFSMSIADIPSDSPSNISSDISSDAPSDTSSNTPAARRDSSSYFSPIKPRWVLLLEGLTSARTTLALAELGWLDDAPTDFRSYQLQAEIIESLFDSREIWDLATMDDPQQFVRNRLTERLGQRAVMALSWLDEAPVAGEESQYLSEHDWTGLHKWVVGKEPVFSD